MKKYTKITFDLDKKSAGVLASILKTLTLEVLVSLSPGIDGDYFGEISFQYDLDRGGRNGNTLARFSINRDGKVTIVK